MIAVYNGIKCQLQFYSHSAIHLPAHPRKEIFPATVADVMS